MSGALRDLGWIIKYKKVYRLMKEHKLLYGGKIRPEPLSGELAAIMFYRSAVDPKALNKGLCI
jgi:hypothetical protein